MAARENVPLDAVSGSGPGGRVVKRDIEAYRASGAPAPAAATHDVVAPRSPTVAGARTRHRPRRTAAVAVPPRPPAR